MEFGIFLNGYIPGPGAHDTDWEHRQLMREAEYAIFADKHNWKYAWFGEHHCLGAHLARIETVAAVERLLAELPDVRLAGVEEPDGFAFRRPQTLRLAWSATPSGRSSST